MLEEELEKIVSRFIRLFNNDKNYYAFDYGLPHKIDEDGKKRFIKKPWFVEKELTPNTYRQHLVCKDCHVEQKKKIDGSPWITDWGLILPPINEKGEVSYGAIDVDIYTKPELFDKIICTPANTTSSIKTDLIVPCVPTGIKTGVSILPRCV